MDLNHPIYHHQCALIKLSNPDSNAQGLHLDILDYQLSGIHDFRNASAASHLPPGVGHCGGKG